MLWVGQSTNLRSQWNIYWTTVSIFCVLFENPQIQVSMNMSIIIKHTKFRTHEIKINYFTVVHNMNMYEIWNL